MLVHGFRPEGTRIAMHTVTLAPGISLLLDEQVAEALRRQLGAGAVKPGATGGRQEPGPTAPAEVLADEHPLWKRHTGLEGHRGEEWRWPEDAARAETFYATIGGKAKVFLDLLIDRPGQLVDVEDICALRPAAFSGSRSI